MKSFKWCLLPNKCSFNKCIPCSPVSFGNKQCIQKTCIRTLASLLQRQSHWVQSNSPSELFTKKNAFGFKLIAFDSKYLSWRIHTYDISANLTVKELSILETQLYSSLAKTKYKLKGAKYICSQLQYLSLHLKMLGIRCK